MTSRGQQIAARLDALRLSARAFEEQTGISRRTVQRAVDGEPSVKDTTYRQIEQELAKLERNQESATTNDRLDITITVSISGADLRRILSAATIETTEGAT